MKRKCKLILDIGMLLLSLTLFSKGFFGMAYHEIAGLVLVGLCAVHIALNARVILAMGKKFLTIPAPVKVGFVVDILLILCYAFMGLSGVMISKTILTAISAQSMVFRLGHTFAAALSVILLGVHMGLHFCRRPMRTWVALALTAAVLCAGVWGLFSSGELRWLTSPFTLSAQGGGHSGEAEHGEGPGMGRGQGKGQGQGMGKGPGNGQGQGQGQGQGKGQHQDRDPDAYGARPSEGPGSGQGLGRGMGADSPLKKLETALAFGGMTLSCAMVTYWIAIPKKKKPAGES